MYLHSDRRIYTNICRKCFLSPQRYFTINLLTQSNKTSYLTKCILQKYLHFHTNNYNFTTNQTKLRRVMYSMSLDIRLREVTSVSEADERGARSSAMTLDATTMRRPLDPSLLVSSAAEMLLTSGGTQFGGFSCYK